MTSPTKVNPVKVQPKPGLMEAVQVTAGNLAAVIEWLRFDLGTCEARDNRIYTHLYDESGGGIIDPTNWLVRLGHRVTIYSEREYTKLFDSKDPT